MEIREYNLDDVKDMINLGYMMHQEGAYKFLPYAPEKLKLLAESFKKNKQGNMWVGLYENKIIGMYIAFVSEYFFCYEKIASDLLLYVHPDYRKKCPSMAIRLIKKAEEWARQQKAIEFCPASSVGISIGKVAKLYNFLKYDTVGNLFKKRL
jgi:GNAT superfamily N-acetyltransferase